MFRSLGGLSSTDHRNTSQSNGDHCHPRSFELSSTDQ